MPHQRRIHLKGETEAEWARSMYKNRPKCKGLRKCKVYGTGERYNKRGKIQIRGYQKKKTMYIGPRGAIYTVNNGRKYYPKKMNYLWNRRQVKPSSVASKAMREIRANRRLYFP